MRIRTEFSLPFQILTKLFKIQFAAGLPQTVSDVIYSRLLQPQLHQSFVTSLREKQSGGTHRSATEKLVFTP